MSLVLAAATAKLVKNPVRFSRRLAAPPRRGLAVGATLTSVATLTVVAAAVLVPCRGAPEWRPLLRRNA